MLNIMVYEAMISNGLFLENFHPISLPDAPSLSSFLPFQQQRFIQILI